jgi:hypothetical protein
VGFVVIVFSLRSLRSSRFKIQSPINAIYQHYGSFMNVAVR